MATTRAWAEDRTPEELATILEYMARERSNDVHAIALSVSASELRRLSAQVNAQE